MITSRRPRRFTHVVATARNVIQERCEVPLMCRAIRVPAGARVLEIGCGGGNALPALWRHMAPCSLTALDIDREALACAQPRVRRRQIPAQLVIGDLEALPFADDAFDVIVDFGTSYHVGDRAAALREIERVLTPGGLWIHETRLAQRIAHPRLAGGTALPWDVVPGLVPHRRGGLWNARRRSAVVDEDLVAAKLRRSRRPAVARKPRS